MAEYPQLPLWTDAYLADTAARLSVEEHGVYLLLMQRAWRDGGAIRGDRNEIIAWISGVCRKMHGRPAARLVDGILTRFWHQLEDGRWAQKRLQKEWEKARNRSETASKAAQKRWATVRKFKELEGKSASATTTTIDSESVLNVGASKNPPRTASGPPQGGRNANGHDRGSRLSEDWEPGDDGVEYARKLGLSSETINETYQSFMCYWLAKAGAAARKVDWDLTWKTWVRTEYAKLREKDARDQAFRDRFAARH